MAEVPKELDIPSLKAQIELFQNNLQRYMATVGVKVNSLAPQVADPTNHIEAQVKAICITLDVPYRIFMGTEKAELASSQDVKTWRTRCNQRNNDYTSPLVVRPVVDRLIALKCLPAPKDVEGYVTKFPDLNTETEQERADVASKQTECLTKYVSGGVDQLVPPQEYLTEFLKMPSDKAEAILKAAEKHVADTEASDAEAALEEAAAAAAAGLPAPGTPTAAVAGQQPPKPGQPSTKPPAAPAKV